MAKNILFEQEKKTQIQEFLHKIFPFLAWIGELKDTKILKSDIIAGLTVAFVLIPQSMAYAQLAWLPIEVGLYTAFIPVLVAWLFWSSRQMSTGPVTIISLMTATALAGVWSSSPEGYMVYASLLALFIWIFYLILWTLKLWVIVEFLSHPIIVWFTNAVAIITITSQAGKIFGISYDKWENYFEWLGNLITAALQYTHSETFLYWILSIAILLLLKLVAPKLPRVLILLVTATFVSYYFWYTGARVEDIPSSFPSLSIPFMSEYVTAWLSFGDIVNIALFAVIIWLIWFTESISVAKFVWTKTRQKVSANRELFGQWLANISSWLFGWYGVAGSFSKTAVNLRAWAKTWFSSVVTSLVVWITLIYLTQYLYYLPMVTLAAVIIVAVIWLIKIEPIIKAWKTERHDGIVAIITFFLTLFLAPNIELGIVVWVILSLALYISRTMKPRFVEVSMYKDWLYRDAETFGLKTSKHISIYRFDGVMYFANAAYFEDRMLEQLAKKKKLKYVILDLEWMSDIDSSWIEILWNMMGRLESIGIPVYITWLRVNVLKRLENYWFLDKFHKKHIFAHIDGALDEICDKKCKDKDIDMEPLRDYKSDKKAKAEEETQDNREIIEKYVEKK